MKVVKRAYGHAYEFRKGKDFKSSIDFQNTLDKMKLDYKVQLDDLRFDHVALLFSPEGKYLTKYRMTGLSFLEGSKFKK